MVEENVRLDQALVAQGLVPSRQRAQAMVRAGLVRVAGEVADRPDQLVNPDVSIGLDHVKTYVSRGGDKLAAALDAFGIDPTGRVGLDVGASTGGFTDLLLQRGAARVIAVDGVIRYVDTVPSWLTAICPGEFGAGSFTPTSVPTTCCDCGAGGDV